MSDELSWSLPWQTLRVDQIRQVAEQVAAPHGLKVEVELEEEDCVSCFFTAPEVFVAVAGGWQPDLAEGEGGEEFILELSFYDLDGDGCVMCVEPEWSDNEAGWDAACQLAEEFAERVDADPLDL